MLNHVSKRAYLGQNFLINPEWQKKIADHFHPTGLFGEIGPGHGELTQHLLKRFSSFCLFEKDERLIPELREKFSSLPVIKGDFLDWDFNLNHAPVADFSFIGNLPYESGSAILVQLAKQAEQVEGFVFLLQKEVVERICARPKTRDFSAFSVLLQGQFQCEALDVISPEHFSPAPKVFSQVIRGTRRAVTERHPLTDEYRKFLKMSFLNKRKTFKNALKSFVKDPLNLLEKFQLSDKARAEEIPLDTWPKIFKEFTHG